MFSVIRADDKAERLCTVRISAVKDALWASARAERAAAVSGSICLVTVSSDRSPTKLGLGQNNAERFGC